MSKKPFPSRALMGIWPRRRLVPLMPLMLLCLGGAALAQGTPPERRPIGDVQILPGTSTLFALSAMFPPAPEQTGRCRPLLADGTLGAALSGSNPPSVPDVVPGQPYTCELEYSRSGQTYLGQATPPVLIVPDPSSNLAAPTADDAVVGLQATPAATSLRLSFLPPTAPGTRIDGYTAVCVEMPGGPPGPILPTRYLAVRGAGSPITVAGLLPSQPYLCNVQPFNAAGQVTGAAQSFATLAPELSWAPAAGATLTVGTPAAHTAASTEPGAGPISYGVDPADAGRCSIDAAGTVTPIARGSCTITAAQAGAASISKTLAVRDKPAPQPVPVPALGAWALALLSALAGLLGLCRAHSCRNRFIP